MAETDMHVGLHAGSDPYEADTFNGSYHGGPGGHRMNYDEARYRMQIAAAKLVTSGVFDRHPKLKCLVSDVGATWVPFMADHLDEAYRQYIDRVFSKFKRLPSEYVFENVYASFQHDRSAPQTLAGMGLRERVLGQRLPVPRRHVRTHSKDTPRTHRRPDAEAAGADHQGYVAGTLPTRAAGA
jgi:predicted TIM-barrel fold metal-dependent hydrolase